MFTKCDNFPTKKRTRNPFPHHQNELSCFVQVRRDLNRYVAIYYYYDFLNIW